MFFWTWRAGLDAEFQMGQFNGMAENVADICCLARVFFD